LINLSVEHGFQEVFVGFFSSLKYFPSLRDYLSGGVVAADVLDEFSIHLFDGNNQLFNHIVIF
jgi:hypothetical protein